MKYVLLYESGPDVATKAPLYFAAHRARWVHYAQQGSLIMIGPFAQPSQGAMSIFTTREAAEEFAKSDPFVTEGVVSKWEIREWREALVPDKS